MLTIKLYGKRHSHLTKILEAREVDVVSLRDGLFSIELTDATGSSQAFYVADPARPRPVGFADEVEFWHAAYVENANGRTTDSVRFLAPVDKTFEPEVDRS